MFKPALRQSDLVIRRDNLSVKNDGFRHLLERADIHAKEPESLFLRKCITEPRTPRRRASAIV